MTRPEIFVFIALSAGWVAIAAWTLRIARRVDKIADTTSESSGRGDSDA